MADNYDSALGVGVRPSAIAELRERIAAERKADVPVVPPTGDTPFPMNVYLRNEQELAAFVRQHTRASDDAQRLDWLHAWNELLLETWFEGDRIVHKVSRLGRVVGTGSTLREAVDAARGVAIPLGGRDAQG